MNQGKRLRPVLVLASAGAFGLIHREHILFSVIMELIHTATLLHDDVLDEADVRRHRRSVNSEWGNATSVLLGDYLFARALMLLSSLGSKDLFLIVSETTRDVCEGELLQINSARNINLSEADYFQMIQKKTATLFAACCKGGARISGADEVQIEKLGQYGEAIGQAFQIVDDILDLMGNPDDEGKTLGTDLKKGKVTLPLIHLFSHLNENDRKFLEDIIAQRVTQISDLQIHNLLIQGQGFHETLSAISRLCEFAFQQLDDVGIPDMTLFRAIPQYLLSQAKHYLQESTSLLKVS
jgi:octaprenyl-diphosphate synthase